MTWQAGTPRDERTKRKISRTMRSGMMRSERHPQWTGDEVSYSGLHKWVGRNKERTGACTFCNFRGRTDFANISGLYLRDLDDYIELCRRCHIMFDGEDESLYFGDFDAQ